MSVYQYIYFAAIDKPLDDKQLAYMARQSTRAEITRWQFENEYHYGDFGGNPVEMMRRGYDVHLHYASYGTRRLMFRLPLGLPISVAEFKKYRVEYGVQWKKDPRGKGGILSIDPEGDAGDYFEGYFEFARMTATLSEIRDALIAGDTRALYLGWLACNWEDDSTEPPVPAGLKKLPQPLVELADFYELDPDLISAAAKRSPTLPKNAKQQLGVDDWLAAQTADDLRKQMSRVLAGDAAAVRAETLAEIRRQSGQSSWPMQQGSRSYGELLELGQEAKNSQRKREAARAERERNKRLARIQISPKDTVNEADGLIQTRSVKNYAVAAKLLAELRDAFPGVEGTMRANTAAKRLVKKYPTLHYLKRAFSSEGLEYK
jgi:hypothetical protein